MLPVGCLYLLVSFALTASVVDKSRSDGGFPFGLFPEELLPCCIRTSIHLHCLHYIIHYIGLRQGFSLGCVAMRACTCRSCSSGQRCACPSLLWLHVGADGELTQATQQRESEGLFFYCYQVTSTLTQVQVLNWHIQKIQLWITFHSS